MKKQKRNKCKTIDDKFTYDQMRDLSTELNIHINDIFCGYLRQPIKVEPIIGKQYIIKGQCALNNDDCNRAVGPLCHHDVTQCPIYKQYFGVKNDDDNKYK